MRRVHADRQQCTRFHLHTDRSRTAMVPYKADPNTRQPNQHYAKAISHMYELLKQPNAVFVYFNDEDRLWYLPSIKELESLIPLHAVKTVKDGTIYDLKSSETAAAR
jgi:hypothetical protein